MHRNNHILQNNAQYAKYVHFVHGYSVADTKYEVYAILLLSAHKRFFGIIQ